MRKDENFSLALDLKIRNSLWASIIKLQDAFRFTTPDLFLNTLVPSQARSLNLILTVLPRTACARTQSYSKSSWKTQRCVLIFISVYFFWWGLRGEREVGKSFISSPPLSSPVKHTSFSSSKNKNCDPGPWRPYWCTKPIPRELNSCL